MVNIIPVFRSEIELSLKAIQDSDEVLLMGKQFSAGDRDLAFEIKRICSQKKRNVIYVNPDSSKPDWVDYHDKLFNSQLTTAYLSLKDYLDYS